MRKNISHPKMTRNNTLASSNRAKFVTLSRVRSSSGEIKMRSAIQGLIDGGRTIVINALDKKVAVIGFNGLAETTFSPSDNDLLMLIVANGKDATFSREFVTIKKGGRIMEKTSTIIIEVNKKADGSLEGMLSDNGGLSDSELNLVFKWLLSNNHPTHKCKYCGDIAEGIDDDILCDDCRETFGHAFYSEL